MAPTRVPQTSLLQPRLRLAWFLVSFVLLAAVSVAVAQPPRANPESGSARGSQESSTPPVTYLKRTALGKGITRAEMSNGLTVLVRENHAAPVATVRCFVRNTGSAYEGEYLGAGLSHVLEHLVAGGTTSRRSEGEIQKLLDTMGGQTNAFTSTDMTAFYIDCPAAHVFTAIELISEAMQFAVIPEKEYQREMGVVQRELEMGEAERARVQHQAIKSLLFTEHPVRHPTIGYLDVVRNIKREQVVNFYRSRYVPQNLVFIVVGDVSTQQVLDKVLAGFKDASRTTERGAVLPVEPDQASPRSSRLQMEGETTDYCIAWPTIPLQHPDLYALDVASYLLANGDSSRIAYRLKIDKPLAISVSGSSYTPGFVRGWFEIALQCPPDNLAACQKVVDEEISRLKNELVSPEELAKVKRQKAAEHVFNQQAVAEQANALAYSLFSTGDPLFDEQYVAGIQQVTAEQVREVARRYLLPERTNTVIIDPLGHKAEVADKSEENVESPVMRRQLPNGLTLLLKRHAVTPIVSIHAFVNGGVLADSDKTSGLAALTSELMSRGTEKYTGRQVAEYFDSIGGTINVDSQRNTSFLQCQILKEDLAKSMDFVHQILMKPKFAEDEFEKARDQQLARLAARQANPQTDIMDAWSTQVPKNSPYSRTILGRPDSVRALTVADCRRYHQQYFVPNNMVLAIFGDIDVEKTASLIEKYFASIPKSSKLAIPKFPAQHPDSIAGSQKNLPRQRENTAMLVMSYPTVAITEEKTRAAIDLLNAVLTGAGGLGGRLFTELRGEQLVYYVFGTELSGPAPGFFLFLAQTRPETLNEVRDRIQKNVALIGKEGIPEDEFERAKERLIASHAMKNTTPATQAFQAAIDELYGFGFNHDQTYPDRIRAVTTDEVKQVVQKYFHDPIVVTSAPPTP